MSIPDWREEPISKKHDRASFDCGEAALNEFLQKHARQSHERGAAKTFAAIANSDGKTILGFYSLCPAALEYAREHLKEEDTMVIVLPDHGTRYLGKIYNDDWMRAQGWL